MASTASVPRRPRWATLLRVVLSITGLMLILPSAPASAESSWICQKRLPNADCIGPATFNEDGERTSGVRGLVGPEQTVWVGNLTHYDRLGVRRVCSYAPTGRCEGQLTTYFPDGKRRVESLRVRDGRDEYYGVSMTFYPDGKRVDCVVNRDGDCDGETVVQLATKEILHGTLKARGYESSWVGNGRWIFRGGEIKDCLVGVEGACRAGPVIFWNRDSKTVGTLGANGQLTGSIAIYEKSGLRKSCLAAKAGGCKTSELSVVRAAPGAWEPPRPKKAAAVRPREIRAAQSELSTVTISPPPDSADIRYQFIVCGDDIRLVYTVERWTRASLPFKGQVWKGAELIGLFDDPGARRMPAGALSCASQQSRSIADLRKHQKSLVQHRFVDGSELWSWEQRISQFLDQLRVQADPVIGPALAAPSALLLTPSPTRPLP